MTGGSFGFLAGPPGERLSVERLTFRERADRDVCADEFRALRLPADAGVAAMLLASVRPADAGMLRGTAAAPPRGGWEAMVLQFTTGHIAPAPLSWSPAGYPERRSPLTYHHHRGMRTDVRPDVTRLAVAVDIDFDPAASDRRVDWVDLVLAAIHTDPAAPNGLVAAQFYLSDDGTRVLNLALWSDEAAYDTALSSGPPGIAQTETEEWREVLSFPGINRNIVTRYTTLVRPST